MLSPSTLSGQSEPPKLLVSAPDAARMLSVSRRTLWSMTAPRGPIPSVRIGSGGVRYSVADLQSFVDSHKQS